jgi:hypothetical protein
MLLLTLIHIQMAVNNRNCLKSDIQNQTDQPKAAGYEVTAFAPN